ncbi:AraC family transcriptional regulator [Thalassotalea sp. M1531]|uniref:AraC family transcriptional regulator n=1 Tax=Thalassotalea algicola TaxID=2716224 RepID=A0A7Y0LA97_9GAMM|nr:helix-turn-helix domain-containing protein [Thalassotalea algicola]NMP30853.1 AraC family transcriptional regulator [Thalassotalea algicola]
MLSLFFSHFAFAQIFICVLLLVKHCRHNQSIQLFILLMVSGAGYILGGLYTYEPAPLFYIGFIAGNALPGVFWLTALSVFADKTHIKTWQYWLAASTLILPLASKGIQLTFGFELREFVSAALIYFYLQLTLELSLIFHALYVSLLSWRSDLVQERRYIRGGVISVSAVYIVLIIIVEQLLDVQWTGLDVIKSAMLAGLITAINYFLFDSKLSVLFVTKTEVKQPKAEVAMPPKELGRIISAMEQDKLYQQEGITISSFAKHLAIHEYKLRHLINGEMNYRNFNDFLNYYRIKEVTEKLIKPEFIQTPVLTLALESGFRSLSSFNKAFKGTHGITPTEYRKKHNG